MSDGLNQTWLVRHSNLVTLRQTPSHTKLTKSNQPYPHNNKPHHTNTQNTLHHPAPTTPPSTNKYPHNQTTKRSEPQILASADTHTSCTPCHPSTPPKHKPYPAMLCNTHISARSYSSKYISYSKLCVATHLVEQALYGYILKEKYTRRGYDPGTWPMNGS